MPCSSINIHPESSPCGKWVCFMQTLMIIFFISRKNSLHSVAALKQLWKSAFCMIISFLHGTKKLLIFLDIPYFSEGGGPKKLICSCRERFKAALRRHRQSILQLYDLASLVPITSTFFTKQVHRILGHMSGHLPSS